VRVAFHPAAAEEFFAAVEYYETALPGLGRRLYEAVRHATELAGEHTEARVATHTERCPSVTSRRIPV
jgi:hypothetical protein